MSATDVTPVEAPAPVLVASGTRGTTRRVALAITTALVTVLTFGAAVLGWNLHRAAALDQARRDASTTARTAIADVLSYDYRTLDADLARGRSDLSPAFRKEYAQVVAQSVRPVAGPQHVVTTATVPAVSVVSATRSRVEVLLYVDQLTTSTKEKNVINVSRVQVTMTRSGGGWLVSDLRAI